MIKDTETVTVNDPIENNMAPGYKKPQPGEEDYHSEVRISGVKDLLFEKVSIII